MVASGPRTPEIAPVSPKKSGRLPSLSGILGSCQPSAQAYRVVGNEGRFRSDARAINYDDLWRGPRAPLN